jgi:hypothetical protein
MYSLSRSNTSVCSNSLNTSHIPPLALYAVFRAPWWDVTPTTTTAALPLHRSILLKASLPQLLRKNDAGSPVAVPAFQIGSGRLPNGFSQIESLCPVHVAHSGASRLSALLRISTSMETTGLQFTLTYQAKISSVWGSSRLAFANNRLTLSISSARPLVGNWLSPHGSGCPPKAHHDRML